MKDRMKLSIQILSAVLLLVAVAGLTYAWFMHNAALSTLIPIEKPDTITLSNLDGTDMIELDLDYREGQDSKDEAGWIHIYRPICIRSTGKSHQLEIAHTTNLVSLKFEIYPVSPEQAAPEQVFDRSVLKTPLRGRREGAGDTRVYENPKDKNDQSIRIAQAELLDNYKADDSVNSYAYPLYWIAELCTSSELVSYRKVQTIEKSEFDVASKRNITFYYTYYYLEISWKETTKETDLFYVLARNVE